MLLKADFRRTVKAYLSTFAHAYFPYGSAPAADYGRNLALYRSVVEREIESIYKAAASGITGYTATYRVLAKESFDEFKVVYFLGRAIEAQLQHAGFPQIAQIHMYIMIGMLDERLELLGIVKAHLTGALTALIKLGRFEQELGRTGCYLIYKCVSTADKHKVALDEF